RVARRGDGALRGVAARRGARLARPAGRPPTAPYHAGVATLAASDQTRGRLLLAQLAGPLRRYIATEAGGAGLALGAALVALVWANSPASDAYVSLWDTELALRLGDEELAMTLREWVNDGLMALF